MIMMSLLGLRITSNLLAITVFCQQWSSFIACKCYVPYETQFGEKVAERVTSPRSHELHTASSLPLSFDWRDVDGKNYCSRVLNQQSPNVCGSCWSEAATGALTDRYLIATDRKLNIQLAPQQLLNFNARTSGGSCNGGDAVKAYDFIHKYGISDDSCAPFQGLNWLRGFVVAAMTEVEEVQAHQCYQCTWGGTCGFVERKQYNLYGVDEFGYVEGEQQMMAEIYARGPIACSLNSDAPQFNLYKGGIIHCDAKAEELCRARSDHVVVIAGWGVDSATNASYWIGRNSYGTQWGEGAGGGWFRLARGSDTLKIESNSCAWATPAKADVQRALDQSKFA